ncbi:MAG: TonB-dependent receptor [Rikenellaceae bacterium]
MKHIFKVSLVVVCLMVASIAKADNIKGRVIDSDGAPLIGATVWWSETNIGVTTSQNGEFSIHPVKDYNSLVASFLGYQNDTITISGGVNLVDFTLSEGITIDAAVVTATIGGNYIMNESIVKAEMISFAGLCKMACCNLAESFENSASVTVGYSDAISGARQIQMLGLAGTYTQILDENRPILRGVSSPYALSYTPGMWLNSIQVSKGISSVVSGREAITGQINLEMRKPTDDERLFLNLYLNDELRPEANISMATQVGNSGKLSTVVLLHGSVDSDNVMNHTDHNGDGFRDMPLSQQFNVANRWLYQGDNGTQIRWGVRALQDSRLGGDIDYQESMKEVMYENSIYGSQITNRNANAYLKVGRPVGEAIYDETTQSELRSNIAMLFDVDYFSEDAYFGLNDYNAEQLSSQLNLMYNGYTSPRSSYIVGLSANIFNYDEGLNNYTPWLSSELNYNLDRTEAEVGIYGEYTYKIEEKFSAIAGVRYDYNSYYRQGYFTPRGHIRYEPISGTVLRASAGMGYRTSSVITDNIGILATGRSIIFEDGTDENFNRTEKALTWGASITQRFSLINSGDATISFDYFNTQLFNHVVVDQERYAEQVVIYSSTDPSSTSTYQVDFTWRPVEGLDIFATYRHTDSSITLLDANGERYSVERALVSRFKTLLNVQYATPYRKWVFDFTAQLNGPSRLPSQSGDALSSEYSPSYPMFFAQVSRRIRDWELYVGCENIANYTQDIPIISADNPYSTAFNSSVVWGPLMGRKFYIGCRFNLF